MVLPVSPNPISLGQIQTEFGGSDPISISEYYNGGPYVTHTVNALAPNVPSSGPIKFSDFYGAAKLFDVVFDISRSSAQVNSFYFSSALGTVTASLPGDTQDQSTSITLKFVKNVSYQITANSGTSIRLTLGGIELEDIPGGGDNDYNDLRAFPRQGAISESGGNFYYLLP
jgi:hypothetical protein